MTAAPKHMVALVKDKQHSFTNLLENLNRNKTNWNNSLQSPCPDWWEKKKQKELDIFDMDSSM